MEKSHSVNYNKKLLIALLLTGTFLAVLNQTILITALPQIMKEFNVNANTAQWLTTSFMLVNGIIVPISAFLISRFTTRQLFLAAMVFFLIGTFMAAISFNFATLLFARFIQAIGAGIVMPLVSNVLLQITPIEKRGSIMGLIILVIVFAPAIGPSLAGAVVDILSWRYLFYGAIPVTLLVLIVSFFILKNVTETDESKKLDLISVLLSSIAFGGILYGLSQAGSVGWLNITTIAWIITGALALTGLVLRELK